MIRKPAVRGGVLPEHLGGKPRRAPRTDEATRPERGPKQRYRAQMRAVSAAEVTTEITPALAAMTIAARALLIQTGWDMDTFEPADDALQAILRALMT